MATLLKQVKIPRLCPNENWWWPILPLQMLEEMPWQEAVWPTMCRQARCVARGGAARCHTLSWVWDELRYLGSFAHKQGDVTHHALHWASTNLVIPHQKFLRKFIHHLLKLHTEICVLCQAQMLRWEKRNTELDLFHNSVRSKSWG